MGGKWVINAFILIMCSVLILAVYQYGPSIRTRRPRTLWKGQKARAQKAINVTTVTNSQQKIANVPVEIEKEMMRLNEEQVKQDDPRLIKLIRDHFIYKPSTEPYNLSDSKRIDYAGQGKDYVVSNTLTDLPEKGFFIECGANNGEFLSSSLYFEKTKHWNGVLIEANLDLFQQLLQKHRKAYALNACLSTKNYPAVLEFNQHGPLGRIVDETFEKAYKKFDVKVYTIQRDVIQLQCFPLYSVLLALDQVNVDFFGLDVEGTEMAILKTIPWDKVQITNILAEFSHDDGKMPAMKNYFESLGYKTIKTMLEDILVQKSDKSVT